VSAEQERLAIVEPVTLVPYSAAWPAAFAAERTRLAGHFPQLQAIEHIGSTAVAGMAAKPIIDILAGVESMAIADALFEPIVQAGYTTSRAFNDMLPDRRWFMRSSGGHRTHHLHVVEFRGATWRKHLLFRDRLRSDPSLVDAYAQLKEALAERYRHDREAYTDAKSAFIEAALKVA
jgi:GrpB-like predicted nucleotidyltransferase (UPF0157 family)